MTVRTVDDIFRDFVIPGVPASGPFNPHKPDIRDTLKALTEGSENFPDNRVIRLNNADEGSANNIVVTASVVIPAAAYQVLYILNVTQENTGPVTVSGVINRTLVTNTSRAIEPGYLQAGMALLCVDTGTELRLLSYGDAEAILSAAEAAAERAEYAAIAAEAAAGGLLSNFGSRAEVALTNIPVLVTFLRTAGYYLPGDGGGALYKRVSSQPTHAGKIQSLDGAWWELAEAVPLITMFGAIADGVTDITDKWQDALNYLKLIGAGEGGAIGVPSNGKRYIVKGGLVAPVGCRVEIFGIGYPQVYFNPPVVDIGTDFLNVGATEYSGAINVIRDVSIWGNGASGRRCINGEFLSNLKLYDVFMYNFVGWCVYAKDCYCLSFEGGQCVGNPAGTSEGGILMSRGTGNQGIVSHVRINDFKGANKTGITLAGNTTETHYGLRIENCAFEFNTNGVYSQAARGLTIDTCYFEYNTGSNITINGTGDTVHSVSILNNCFFEGGPSGCVFINCNGLWISGNSFQYNANCYIEDSQGRYQLGINTFTNGGFQFAGGTPRKNFEKEAAWLSFASTWISSGTQPSLGNGNLVFKYKRSGNTVECVVTLTMGSTSTYGSVGYGFRLPFNIAAGSIHIGKAGYYRASTDGTIMTLTTMCSPGDNYVSLRNDAGGVVGPTAPITFASGDRIYASFTYECVS